MKRFLFLPLVIIAVACGTEKQSDQDVFKEKESSGDSGPGISRKSIKKVMESIPSPIETSALIKRVNKEYHPEYLNDPDRADQYNTSESKALNLGVYGTDLGYVNIYEKSGDAFNYLQSIQTLADDLSIGQFFDIQMIKRLVSQQGNKDSLMYITINNFQDINDYLRQHNRSDQSVLLLLGGWLEAMHITCQVNNHKPSKELENKIGEQKIVLSQLLNLLSKFNYNPETQSLVSELENLTKVYKKVEINKNYEKSVTKEVDGVLVVKDKTTTEVVISDEEIREITNKISSIRNGMIKK